MEFGPVPTPEAEGAILAHAVRTAAGRIPKGRRLTTADVAAIAEAGIEPVTVARLGPDDLDENAAAARIAEALASDSLRAGPAANGRCNLYARHAGLVTVDAGRVSAANLIDEALTLATLPAFASVEAGQLAATVKIITFGAPSAKVGRVAAAAARTVSVAAFRPQKAALIQTRLPHTTDALLEKTERSTRERLHRIAAAVTQTGVTDHRKEALAAAFAEAATAADLIVAIGASAIVDRRDVVPAAIAAAGGVIEHFGLPVDPGNLTLLAQLGDARIVAMPGSARSPREQGSDWLLERLAAGLPVDAQTIAGFGVGGLLKEIRSRPMPRDRSAPTAPAGWPTVDAILLAAGRSMRMGERNKLLEPIGEQPMIRRVAAAIHKARIRRLVVVTGYRADRIRQALAEIDCIFADNPDYRTGMGSSVAAGAGVAFDAADPPDAAIICLGDMPDIAPAMLDVLIRNYDPAAGRTVVAAASGGVRGHPVLWDRRFADDLASLTGDAGARDILREHAGQVVTVEMDDAVLRDLDTPAAFDAYRSGTAGAGDSA